MWRQRVERYHLSGVRFKPVCYQTCQSNLPRCVAVATSMFGSGRIGFDWPTGAERRGTNRELPNLVILVNHRRRKETRGFQAGRSSFDPTLGTGLCFFYLGWFASTLRVLQVLEETGCCHRVGCVWGKPSKDLFLREILKLNILRDFCEN